MGGELGDGVGLVGAAAVGSGESGDRTGLLRDKKGKQEGKKKKKKKGKTDLSLAKTSSKTSSGLVK